MFNRYRPLFLTFFAYMFSITCAFSSLRTWSDHYSRSDESSSLSNNSIYVGIRGYSSMMSANSIENNLKGKSFRKEFYRVYCVGANPNDKWLCGDILSSVPSSASNSYETAGNVIDLSKEQFSTQNISYQLPGFSIILGKSVLADGFHAELEFGSSSSASSNGGLFAGKRVIDISALAGGTNVGGGTTQAPDAIPGLDKYPVQLDSTFSAELSKSFLGFNLIYDIDISEIKPFIGVGFAYTMYTTMLNLDSSDQSFNKGVFGDAFTDGKVINTQEHKFNRIAYSLLAGFSYPVSNTVTAEIGYKHTFGGNLDWKLIRGGKDASAGQLPVMTVKNAIFKELFLGLKYSF